MHLNSINVDCMSITELEALHKANAKRPTQVPLSALRTATQYFQAKDGVIEVTSSRASVRACHGHLRLP